MSWESLADYSIVKPEYYMMERAFDDYRGNTHPAGPVPKNHCAIRMSLALGRCGFSFHAFPNQHRVLKHLHELPFPVVMGARELAEYLRILWGRGEVFKTNMGNIASRLGGRKGIVFFENCSKPGDHIDLWNGKKYYNDIINVPAHLGDRIPHTQLFNRSDQVWFFALD
jgi:hypothetical protein